MIFRLRDKRLRGRGKRDAVERAVALHNGCAGRNFAAFFVVQKIARKNIADVVPHVRWATHRTKKEGGNSAHQFVKINAPSCSSHDMARNEPIFRNRASISVLVANSDSATAACQASGVVKFVNSANSI